MSRRSEQARTLVTCGVLLGTLELLSIAAATRWPTVDDPPAPWQHADARVTDAATARPTADASEFDETQASLLLGQQVLARFGGALDAARFDLASRAGAHSPYDRFCPVTHGCD